MNTPEQTLSRFRDVVVSNSSRILLALSIALHKKSHAEQRDAFGGEYKTGFFYLYRNEAIAPGVVMETVVSTAGDGITSLYVNHPALANLSSLVSARRELVAALSEKIGLSVDAVGVDDPGRGRVMGLSELATGQLIDLLAESMGRTVTTTGTHGGDLDILGKLA